MYKENIFNLQLRKLYYVIVGIFDVHPLWWEVFVENIINNHKVTYINGTTIIISLYELDVSKVIILFQILKQLKKKELLTKIINKREFLIIHVNDEIVLEYIKSKTKWILLVTFKMLNEEYPNNKIYIKDELIFVNNNKIYYLITEPKKNFIYSENHQYIYLFKNMYINHLGIIEKHLKFYSDKDLFIKKFNEFLR